MIVDTLIAGLAGTRLTRAWSFEEIGDKLREPLEEWLDEPLPLVPGTDQVAYDEVNWTTYKVKTFFLELVSCPFCIGFWLTLGCVVALRFKWTRPLVIGLAAATIQSAAVDHYPGFDHEEGDEG